MCSTPTKAPFIERLWNQKLKLKPHPKAHLAVPPGCCLGMLALTFSDAGELHRRNTEKSYPDSAHWQKVPQSYPDYLDKTFPLFFSCIRNSYIKNSRAQVQLSSRALASHEQGLDSKKKKTKTQEGRERKKRKGRFWHYAMCTEATFSCAPPLRELQWIQQRWLMGNLPKVLRKRGYHQFFFFLCSLRWDLHTDVPTYSLRLILTTIISQ